MKNKLFFCVICSVCALPLMLHAQSVRAESIVDAKALYNENCVRCHDESVYIREDRRISSYAALERQVKRCELPARVTWSDAQVQGVVDFLNDNYYGFTK